MDFNNTQQFNESKANISIESGTRKKKVGFDCNVDMISTHSLTSKKKTEISNAVASSMPSAKIYSNSEKKTKTNLIYQSVAFSHKNNNSVSVFNMQS